MKNGGTCIKCGHFNDYSKVVCTHCNTRLPWADAVDDAARVRIPHALPTQWADSAPTAKPAPQPARTSHPFFALPTPTQSRQNHTTATIAAVLFVLFVVMPWACNMLSGPASPEREAQETEEHNRLLAYGLAEQHVQAMLKAPTTAKFAGFEASTIVKVADDHYNISSYVDSQNGFGAMLRSRWTADVTLTGKADNGDSTGQVEAHIDDP